MIHFDFDDRYQDELVVGSAISRREGVVWSGVFHVVVLALLLFVPQLEIFQPTPEELEQARLEQLERERLREPESERFVYVEPLVELPAEVLRDRVELSDRDRRSQTRERAPTPENTLPFSRGNTPERTEAAAAESPRAIEPVPPPDPPQPAPEPAPQPAPPANLPTPSAAGGPLTPPRRPFSTSAIRETVQALGRNAQVETFNNPYGGGTDPGSAIQFDTKGIDFGPWLRRFVIKVRNNWIVPQSAFAFRGHVVLQFHVHRDGRITDLNVVKPAEMDGFNVSSRNAISLSDPVEPLPVEYPDDKILFTVTFYYNELPGSSP